MFRNFFIGGTIIWIFIISNWFINLIFQITPYSRFIKTKKLKFETNPCEKLNNMELFLRGFHRRKLLYKYVFQKSLSIFWVCRDNLKVVVVLDNESKADHELGAELEKEFPYPRVVYEDPLPNFYNNKGYLRQQFSMFYAENYTNATYVGFVDTDTLFTTVVTPGILFEDNKPSIIGRIGLDGPYWENVSHVTQRWFGHKEIMRGMSYFPVILKVKHIVELRKWLENKHNTSFGKIFGKLTKSGIFSQFTIMCQYVWMFHRDQYSFHFEPMPDNNYNYKLVSKHKVSPSYYKENLMFPHWLPKPRSSIHWSYPWPYVPSVALLSEKWLESFIREGFCYSIGIQYCPEKCDNHKFSKIHTLLYLFEGKSWAWHKLALHQQKLHYREVHQLLFYMNKLGKSIFGFNSIEEACDQWPVGYNFFYPKGRVSTRVFHAES